MHNYVCVLFVPLNAMLACAFVCKCRVFAFIYLLALLEL